MRGGAPSRRHMGRRPRQAHAREHTKTRAHGVSACCPRDANRGEPNLQRPHAGDPAAGHAGTAAAQAGLCERVASHGASAPHP